MTAAFGPVRVRLATAADLSAINTIYNYYVIHSTATYQTEPEEMAERIAWFRSRGRAHPVTVAEYEGAVVGWGALSPFRQRAAYAFTVENSVYVRHDLHRCGIGQAILLDLIDRATAAGHHSIIAAIDAERVESVAIHARFGFEHVGQLREAGFKFGRWLDVIYMQKMLASVAGRR